MARTDEQYVVGKLAMDQILWNDALADGVPLFDICDNDSQGLHEAHVILTNGNDSFRPDLRNQGGHEAMSCSFMGQFFIRRFMPYRQGILDTPSTSSAKSPWP